MSRSPLVVDAESPHAVDAGVSAHYVAMLSFAAPSPVAAVGPTVSSASPSVFEVAGLIVASIAAVGVLVIAVWLVRMHRNGHARTARSLPRMRDNSVEDAPNFPHDDAAQREPQDANHIRDVVYGNAFVNHYRATNFDVAYGWPPPEPEP
ncbi:MAG: hypothetical protein EOO65_04845, partial [Methanosarcinales archaeon]